MSKNSISRRQFIKVSATAGTGLALGFFIPWTEKLLAGDLDNFEPNIWLSIDKDGIVTFIMPRSELGQKVWTSLTQIVAEELEADWSKIKVVQGDLNPGFGSQTTGGSASIRTSYDKLRKAGATAREMLITAAANKWQVPRESCRAENGTVIHIPTKKILTYGELSGAAAKLPIPEKVPLKDPREFKIIGKAIKSLDAVIKIDGSAVYGYDFTLPGMLIAVIARCPVFGGKAVEFDDSRTMNIRGVKKVVSISSGIAVVAENTWAALEGRKKLNITWDEGEGADLNSTYISQTLKNAAINKGTVIRNDGDSEAALKSAAAVIEAEFEVPYLDHAPMEPMNCTAEIKAGLCQVWVPTQNPGAAFKAAESVTGFEKDSIKIHTLRSGGGFGRRLQSDFVQDAVETAQKVKAPVKVIRLRSEDIQHGFYRPATYHKLRAGLDQKGSPVAWSHRISGQKSGWPTIITGGAAELPYDISNILVDYVMSPISVPIGAWRSVAHTQNAFVNECLIDELAGKAGKDPYDFRRSLLLNYPRHRGVLDLAAEKAGWGSKLPKGRAQGIAVHYSFNSYAAVVAELSVNGKNEIKIHKMVCAIDCGIVINPDGVKAQVEGGITLGITAALYGAITIKAGRVQESNFHDYKLLKMKDAPLIETYMVPSTEAPTGAGEPPVPPTPPALINALAAATGKRIYKLPLN